MRWPILLLAALVLAGCLAGSQQEASQGERELQVAGWQLECPRLPGWSDPCTARATIENGPANENWLAVNPTDPQNVVTGAKDYNDAASDCVWSGETSSTDGGRTWRNQYVGGTKQDRMDPAHPLFGYQCVTDPMFAFDAQGLLYWVIEAYGRVPHQREGIIPAPTAPLGPLERQAQHPDTGGNTMFIAVSRDGGATFGEPVRVWDGEGTFALLDDKTFILANPASGTIYFATSQFAAGPASATQILAFRSTDQGASWSQPVVASDPADSSLKFPAAFSAARDGTLYLTWHDWAQNRIVFTRSTDDGQTFEVPRPILATQPLFTDPPNAEYRVVTQPYHAVDVSGGPRDGTIYLTWMEEVDGHMDIRISESRDQGATWSEPRVLTDDATLNDQFHPAIAVDDRGAVHVTYYDRRYDPDNRLLDLTWAVAEDGERFRHLRITDSSFDGDVGFHQDGFPFIGDYNGLACQGSVCYASFADTRDGRSDIAVARLVRS